MNIGRFVQILPLLGIPVAIYVIMALIGAGSQGADVFISQIQDSRVAIPMPSGMKWGVSGGDLIIMLGLVLLFVELIRGVGTSRFGIIHHTLSVLLALGAFGLFLIAKPFATSCFLMLTIMCSLDALGGIIVQVATTEE